MVSSRVCCGPAFTAASTVWLHTFKTAYVVLAVVLKAAACRHGCASPNIRGPVGVPEQLTGTMAVECTHTHLERLSDLNFRRFNCCVSAGTNTRSARQRPVTVWVKAFAICASVIFSH